MKKRARLTALFLSLAILCATVPAFAYHTGTLLPQAKTYKSAFSDTKGTWCDSYVQTVYEVGLMDGKSASKFDPKGTLTCAQIIAVTARLHALLNGGDGKFAAKSGEEWYQPYLNYLTDLAADNDDLSFALWYVEDAPYQPCDRYDFVWLLAAILPDSALKAINTITALPDEAGDEDVLSFYNAGILTGVNAYGTFSGTDALNRGQAAAMLARIADPSQRMKFTPKAFSYAKELLGLDAQTTVLTVDGYAVSAELYAYTVSSYISSYEISASYGYYETYAKYLDEYYADETYESFAAFLLGKYGIDVSKEISVAWDTPDKAGLSPAQKVSADVLEDLKQIAELFNHAGNYPLTDAQKTAIASEVADERALFYGFSDTFVTLMESTFQLMDNISAKYAPSNAELNGYLNEYGYFYGRYLTISYDLNCESGCGTTKAEALQTINSVRQQASSHLSDVDYFGYLCWKYGDDYVDEAQMNPVDDLSDSTRTALKNLSVGSLSQVLNEEDSTEGYGTYYLFLKDDPSQDENVLSTIGSIPAYTQLTAWAESAKVVTTAVFDAFSISKLADQYDRLSAAGMTGGL